MFGSKMYVIIIPEQMKRSVCVEQHLLQIKTLRDDEDAHMHKKKPCTHLSISQPLQFDNSTKPYCDLNFILINCAVPYLSVKFC